MSFLCSLGIVINMYFKHNFFLDVLSLRVKFECAQKHLKQHNNKNIKYILVLIYFKFFRSFLCTLNYILGTPMYKDAHFLNYYFILHLVRLRTFFCYYCLYMYYFSVYIHI